MGRAIATLSTTVPIPNRRPTATRAALGLCLALVALALLGTAGALHWYHQALQPLHLTGAAADTGAPPAYVEVRPGDRAPGLGRRLDHDGVVRSALAFRLRAAQRKLPLQAGTYEAGATLSVDALLDLFASGRVASRSVTFPEGFTLRQCADRAAQAGFGSAEEYVQLATQQAGGFGVAGLPPGASLEGYLFPDTYRLPPTATSRELIAAQLKTFVRVWREVAGATPPTTHTRHEYVIIAAMIEREARHDDERANIAGVIENRLHRSMKLQIDATVLYALGTHKARVTYRDLAVESPYNTYRVSGLPAGPIANPGAPSLAAAVKPARHEFLYYTLGADGHHVFTKNEAAHNQATAQARAGKGGRP